MFIKILSLITLSAGLIVADKVQLNADPIKENALGVEKIFSLSDKNDEGFYQGTSASHAANGKFVLLDKGNKKIHIFNKKGEELFVFGKEGNGPGELARPFKIFASNERIFVRQDMKISIFDYKGKHIKDASLVSSGSTGFPIFHENKILLSFTGNTKDKFIEIDGNGKIVKTVKNTEYERPEDSRGERMMVMIKPTFDYISTENGFYHAKKGEYSFEHLDKNFKLIKTYSKTFKRVKQDFSRFKIDLDDDSWSKEEKARQMARAMEMMRKRFGEYRNDVSSMLGYLNGKLLISVASEGSGKMLIHVIEDDKFLTEKSIEVNGEISETRIENAKLIINYKHKEDGPLVDVYSLSI